MHPSGLSGDIHTHTTASGDIYNWQADQDGDAVSIMGVRIPVADLLELAGAIQDREDKARRGAFNIKESRLMSMIENVRRGVEFLDENEPGWLKLVKLDELNLTDPFACVLGQVWHNRYNPDYEPGAGYWRMLDKYASQVEDEEDWAIKLGFTAPSGNGGESYEKLNDTWEYIIAELREERAL